MQISRNAYIVMVVVVFAVAAYGISYNVAQAASSNSGSGSAGAYSATLVITTNNIFNQTVGDQPAYYVLGSNGSLQSSAVINFPQDRTISLTIINYDDGPANVSSQYASVIGTTNNQMTIVNNTNVNSSQGASGINIAGGQVVSSVPDTNIAHTFTILSGSTPVVNLPVPPSSVVHATFTLQSGSYNWQCEAACGSGSVGWGGAMSTPGWMTGTISAN